MASRPKLQPSDFRPIARLVLVILSALSALLAAPVAMGLVWGRAPAETPANYGFDVAVMVLPAVAAAGGWILHAMRRERTAIAVAAPAAVLALAMMVGFVAMTG